MYIEYIYEEDYISSLNSIREITNKFDSFIVSDNHPSYRIKENRNLHFTDGVLPFTRKIIINEFEKLDRELSCIISKFISKNDIDSCLQLLYSISIYYPKTIVELLAMRKSNSVCE